MNLKRKRVSMWAAGAVLVVIAGIGIAVATVTDNEQPIQGESLARASAAALEYTGGGTVTDSEVGDEEGYYEVEVTLADGREVDVHLDQNFRIINSTSDGDDGDGKDIEDR